MARIPYFDPAQATGKVKQQFDALPDLNIFRMLAHSGDLMDGFSRFGGYLLNKTELDPVLREIAIIRVGVLSGATYEAHQHRRIGRRIGMSDALIAGIDEGPASAAFTPLQRQVMEFTDDLVKNVRASDATFDPLAKALGYKQIQELTITIGYYMLVSRFLETFDVEIETPDKAPSDDQMPGVRKP
jgi:4-carboxymuconolactone decarboxylase